MSASERWFAVAVLGGVAGVILAAIVVVGWGHADPSPPFLPDSPNPAIPGDVLYFDRDACLTVARASGEGARRVYCTGAPPLAAFFVDDRVIAFIDSRTHPNELVKVDIETRRELSRTVVRPERMPDPATAPDGTQAFARENGRVQLIRDGQVTGTIKFDGLDWGPQPLGWSPDSQWLVFSYWRRDHRGAEIWLVSRDGTVRGTLAREAVPPSLAWRIDGLDPWPPLPR
jgi:hypothetical protein